MPVSIPKLNSIDPGQALPANDRFNFKVQDQASNIMNQTQGIAKIGNAVGDVYQQYEDDAITNLSYEAEQEYSAWNKEQLRNLKSLEGDPTDAYQQYEENAKTKRDEILGKRPDVSDRVKNHVTARFDKEYASQNLAADYQRGAQKETYDNNVYESKVKSKKDELAVNAGYIQAHDPSSTFMFDENINDMKTVVARRGMQKGTVTRLPDDAKAWTHSWREPDEMVDGVLVEGEVVKVKFDELASQKYAKEASEGVRSSIDVMIASGRLEEAKMMQEKYKGYLDPKGTAAIEKKIDNYNVKGQAYDFMGTLGGKSSAEQMRAINELEDPRLKSEALKIKDTDDNRRENIRERQYKANYESLANPVLEKMQSDQPFYGMADLEEDKQYKLMYDNLDSKGKKAIQEMIIAPKESSEKSLASVNSFLLGETDVDMESMSYAEFQKEYLVGLTKTDKNKYTREFNRLKKPSAFAERSSSKRGNQLLKDELTRAEYIIKDDSGRYSGEDQIRLLNVQDKLMGYLSELQTIPSEEQMRKIVKDLSAAEIQGKVFNPPPRKTVKKTSDEDGVNTSASAPKVPSRGLQGLTSIQTVNYQADYKRKYGNIPRKTDPKFLQFVNETRRD